MQLPPPTPEESSRLAAEVLRSGARECPHCGSPVLHATPGQTTVEEIRAFAGLAGRRDIERYGWIHPGCYCPRGCFQVLIEYEPSLFLVSAGPRRLAVIARVKELFGVSLEEARALVDGGEVRLGEADRSIYQRELQAELEALGATVRIGF